MNGRTFLGRFSAATGLRPIENLQQVHIAKAREILERTVTPVDRIAWYVGYADPAALRKLVQKLTDLPPIASSSESLRPYRVVSFPAGFSTLTTV